MAKTTEIENNTINLIGVGTDITGDVNSNGDFRIDGSLKGNIRTKGKVIVGATGTVKGEIYCKNSDIEGKVHGKINVQELLTLKATAVINGDIVAKRLAIEPGSKFTGNCNMSNESDPADATTQKGPEKIQEKPK